MSTEPQLIDSDDRGPEWATDAERDAGTFFGPRPWPEGDAEPAPIGPRHSFGLKCDCDECETP